jgi:hypothetical protein
MSTSEAQCEFSENAHLDTWRGIDEPSEQGELFSNMHKQSNYITIACEVMHVEGRDCMRKLYVSDLDGTLLNNHGEMSDAAADMLNRCLELGINFSINTARTPSTVFPIMKDVHLNLPFSMMNGVLVYNPVQQEYLNIHYMTSETAMVVLGIIKLHKLQCFLYTMEAGTLCTYYDSVESRSLNKFRNERIQKYDKVFQEVDDLSICVNKGVVYFCLRERRELLEGLYRDLQAVRGAHAKFYPDVYHEEWMYLEIYSDKASKAEALNTIKEWGRFDYLIGFGDAANDIEMFQVCNETYAVSNATPEIQDMANGIIPSNEDYGVPRFLRKVLHDAFNESGNV